MTLNALQAQPVIKKGTIMPGMTSTISLGGAWGSEFMSVGFLKSNDDYKERILNLMPSGGIAVIDNLAVRIQTLIGSRTEISTIDDTEYHSGIFSLGPYVTYYYPVGSFALMADGGVMAGRESYRYSYPGSEYEDQHNVFVIEIFGGIAKNISENVQLNALTGYSRASWKPVDGGDEIEGDVCQGLVIKVGFIILLDLGVL